MHVSSWNTLNLRHSWSSWFIIVLSSKHWNLIIQRVLIELAGLMESRLRHQNHRNHPQLSSATWREDFRCQSAKATHLIPPLCAVHLYQKNEESKNTNTAVPACKHGRYTKLYICKSMYLSQNTRLRCLAARWQIHSIPSCWRSSELEVDRDGIIGVSNSNFNPHVIMIYQYVISFNIM